MATPLRAFLALTFLTGIAGAHGGQYRGPGNVVPPSKPLSSPASPAGAGGSAGAGGGPATGAATPPASATAGGPASSGNAVGSAAGLARGVALDDDLTRWEFWWEFGKDPYLRVRDAVGLRRDASGMDDALLGVVRQRQARDLQPLPHPERLSLAEQLLAILRTAKDRDTISSCLVALAKIGQDGATTTLREAFLPYLSANDQELRETAALALGIAGQTTPETLDLLLSLGADTAEGRRVSGGVVHERTRAFATFGIGTLLHRCREPRVARLLTTELVTWLDAPTTGRELQVATIEALARFPADWRGPAANLLREDILAALDRFYSRPLGVGSQLMQAHVPTAIAALIGRQGEQGKHWIPRLVTELEGSLQNGPHGKGNAHIAQSCALALGDLCGGWDVAGAADEAACRMLLRVFREHRDHQTRAFALLALGRIGGAQALAELHKVMTTQATALEKPWAAMAIGVAVARAQAAAAVHGGEAPDHGAMTAALREALSEARNPGMTAALAVALGLSRDREAADSLRQLLRASSKREDLAGYLCIGLGLLGDELAVGELRAVLRSAERRPQLLLQSARALGMLGDHAVAQELCQQIEAPDQGLARLSALAAALGQLGDRRSVAPLLRMANNPDLTPLTRAFAVVALGSIADKDPLPWNAGYATNTNYRAATETLTDGASGILDIL